jgi:glycolate oxidase FAD binding subunit
VPPTATLPLRPTTTADLAARIGGAGDSHIRVSGSNSLPLLAFDPARPITEVSTLRLNKVLEQSPPDMTVAVHAGITLEALQRQLAWQDQWLPVDPPVVGGAVGALGGRTPGQRTIGGLVATNSLGPLRFGIGDWRLLVLGMKWIDASGTLLSTGSRTVKNVAGYAAHRLLIGSGGALGVIAEVTLRTFARPADEQCLILFCESPAQAEALVAAVLLAPVTPAYLQIVGGATFAANPLNLPPPPAASGGGQGDRGMAVVVGFLGRPDTCRAQIDLVRRLPLAQSIESIAQTAAQAGRLRLWMTTEPAIVPDASGIGFRLHVRSSQVAALVARLEALSPDLWVVSEAASGVLRGTLRQAAAAQLEAFSSIVRENTARLLITQGTPVRPPAQDNGLAARLKRTLDPASRFGSWLHL